MMPHWVEIAVSVPRQWMEAVCYQLREMGSGGVAIEDPALLNNLAGAGPELMPDCLPAPDDPAVIKAYFPAGEEKEKIAILNRFLARVGPGDFTVKVRQVAEQDWQEAWKTYYRPVKVGQRMVIKPAWQEYVTGGDRVIIDMDPGQAFGTGTHPTTVMCLEMIEAYTVPGVTVADIGTGSGILAVAAALMGARQVLAVDSDPVAVRVAGENVKRNGVHGVVEVGVGNLLDNVSGGFGIIVANILSSVIKELAPEALRCLRPEGRFIASGIIRERLPEVRESLENAGFCIERQSEKGEWIALAGYAC